MFSKDIFKYFNLEDEIKADVAERIISESKGGRIYWLQVVLSNTIAVLGLLINSIPVVIGAMLIAPLMGPIQGISFGVASGNRRILLRSVKILSLTVIVSVINSYLISILVPFAEVTEEIEARTNPTFIDICIAIASGIIAFFSLGFSKQFGTSISGVAMAASLMPPLAVIGVGIGFNKIIDITQGSSLLFLANLVAIIIVGAVMLRAFGFVSIGDERKGFSTRNFIFISVSALLVSVPLFSSMFLIASELETRHKIEDTLDDTVPSINEKIRIVDFSFEGEQKDTVDITVEIHIPQGFTLTSSHQRLLSESLSASLEKSVNLDIFMLPLIEVSTEKEEEEKTDEQIFQEQIERFLDEEYEFLELYQFEIRETDDRNIVYLGVYAEQFTEREEFRDRFKVKFTERLDTDKQSVLIVDWEGATERPTEENDLDDINPFLLEVTAQFQEQFPNSDLLNLTVPEVTREEEQGNDEPGGEEGNVQDDREKEEGANGEENTPKDEGSSVDESVNSENLREETGERGEDAEKSDSQEDTQQQAEEEKVYIIEIEFRTPLLPEEVEQKLSRMRDELEADLLARIGINAKVSYFDRYDISTSDTTEQVE